MRIFFCDPDRDVFAARAVGEGGEGVGGGDGEEEGATRREVFRHAEEHKQSGMVALGVRTIGGDGEAAGGGGREEEGGARGRVSFHADEHD
jgi:hypothetical protein